MFPGAHATQLDRNTKRFSLEENVVLAPLTTFGIGGPARWYAAVKTEEELAAACAWARARRLPVFVLSGGSNVLVADGGFPGLVLHVALRGIAEHDTGGKRVFTAAAGEDWDALVTRTVEADCAGMECLAGIPGTVGGTPVQNVGAYGQEVAQTIVELRCFDRQSGGFIAFSAEDCEFRYRSSRFNHGPDAGRYIVTSVSYALLPGGAPALGYADLQRRFPEGTQPSLAETAAAVRAIRREKGMVVDPVALPERDPDTRSAGSFFKNPIVPETVYAAIAASVAPAPVPSYPAPLLDGIAQRKLPAAWLLEQGGFPKGYALGGAAVSSKHTLALTNRSGRASAAEIMSLRDLIIEGVARRFGVVLQPEPVFVGPPAVITPPA